MTTPRVLALIAVCSILVLAPAGWQVGEAGPEAEAPRRPMLWVLEGDAPVYLLGTIHVPDTRVTELLDVVTKAFEASEVFYAELAMDPGAMAAVQHLMMLTGEPWLDEQVGPEVWARLEKVLAGGQIPLEYLKHLKPWVVSMQLLQKAMAPDAPAEDAEAGEEEAEEEKPPPEAMDLTLYTNAAATGKVTGGLETLKEQIDVFDSLTAEEQVAMLGEMLEVVEGQQAGGDEEDGQDEKAEAFEAQFDAMIRLYRAGDADGLGAIIRTSMEEGGETMKKFMTRLIDGRNVTMTDRIVAAREKHKGKTIFVAVGSGHFPGDGGIVALLRSKGHTVRRLEIDSELPAKVEAE